MILTVKMEEISKAAAVLSALMDVYTIPCLKWRKSPKQLQYYQPWWTCILFLVMT